MSSNKLILWIIGATLIIIFGGAMLANKLSGQANLQASKKAKVELVETDHDWGTIKIDGGKVQKEFVIKNIGSGELSLANVITSCMCTTAQVEINGQKSPFFGMHSNSTWVGKVASGGQAKLTVEFDPAYHGPNAIGKISRQATVETNDASQPKLTFNLTAQVIK